MRWLFRILPSPTPQLDDHVSVWSVSARNAKTFFGIAGALWLVAIGFIGYRKKDQSPWNSGAGGPFEQDWIAIGEFILAVLADFGNVGIAITIVAMLLTRALNSTGGMLMTLYQAMVNRFVIPVIEEHRAEGRERGLVEGRQRGLAEGRERGRAENQTEWLAWNARRLDAEREGREFTEPPPEG